MPNAHNSRVMMGYNGTLVYAIGTVETPVFEHAYTNYRRVTGAIDINAFTVGKLITARTYIRVDGVNYRQVDSVIYTVAAAGQNHPSFDVTTRQNFMVTIQLNIVEAGQTNVPWHSTVEMMDRK